MTLGFLPCYNPPNASMTQALWEMCYVLWMTRPV